MLRILLFLALVAITHAQHHHHHSPAPTASTPHNTLTLGDTALTIVPLWHDEALTLSLTPFPEGLTLELTDPMGEVQTQRSVTFTLPEGATGVYSLRLLQGDNEATLSFSVYRNERATLLLAPTPSLANRAQTQMFVYPDAEVQSVTVQRSMPGMQHAGDEEVLELEPFTQGGMAGFRLPLSFAMVGEWTLELSFDGEVAPVVIEVVNE